MWTNRSSDLPFMPKRPYEAWSFAKVVEWRGDKFPRNQIEEQRDGDGTRYPMLNWAGKEVPNFGRLPDRCVMPVLRALNRGELRAYVQFGNGFQPISKELWGPDECGEWPLGWLFGRLEETPYGSMCPRELEEPFRGATIMFLDYEVKRWASSNAGKPKLRSDESTKVAYERVMKWLGSFDISTYTGTALYERAVEHFRPHIVLPFHVKKARRTIEAGPRKSGPKGRTPAANVDQPLLSVRC